MVISGSFNGSGRITSEQNTEELAQPPELKVGKPKHKEYTLFIGLHQGRRLQGLDETGLSDPFVVIHCFGRSFKSDIIPKRLNPVWHRGYLLQVLLPDPIEFAPPLLVQVWDHDPNKREIIGSCYLSTEDAVMEQLNVTETDPIWYPLYIPNPKDTAKQIEVSGQMLLSLQLVSGHNITINSLHQRLLIHDATIEEQIANEQIDRDRKQKENEAAKQREQIEIVEENKENTANGTGSGTRPPPRSEAKRIVAKQTRKFNPRYIELTPKWKEMEIQIYVLGLRNMRTPDKINKPFVSIHFPNGVNLATNPSNLPSPESPNFCQFFTVKQQLPVQSIFSPAIRVAVRDNKSFAFSGSKKKNAAEDPGAGVVRIGWAFVELQDFLGDAGGVSADGWTHPNEFKKMQKMKENQAILDRIAKAKQLRIQREKEKNAKQGIDNLNRNEGAGEETSDHDGNRSFYGESDGDSADAANAAVFRHWFPAMFGDDDAVFSDDGIRDDWSDSYDHDAFLRDHDDSAKEKAMSWEDLIGLYRVPALRERTYFESEMESQLDLNPFIITEIESGGTTAKKEKVGDLKCLIRVVEGKDDEDEDENAAADALSHLTVPNEVMCRVYILRALDLIPQNNDGDASCDPYYKIMLNGESVINTRAERVPNTSFPDFYEVHQLPVKLPGDSQIGIAVYDWNGGGIGGGLMSMVGSDSRDDLIGQTFIDLEDRWFSSMFHCLSDKPIEKRALYHPSSKHKQVEFALTMKSFQVK